MSRIELEILGLSSSQSQSGSFALVLGEKFGKRRLPIIIGMFEAQAIAIELEDIKPSRPMTHDLFKDFISGYGIELLEIVIENLKEGVFYAKIVSTNSGKTIEFDARPSDAIALGIRFGVPIYTTEAILEESGITPSEFEESEEEQEHEDELETVISQVEDIEESQDIEDFQISDLNEMLEKALQEENYEEAAKIRDEINKRTS